MNQVKELNKTIKRHAQEFHRLYIDHFSLKEIEKHLETAYPDEGCGFVMGKENPDGSRSIEEILPVKNAKEGDQRRRFQIDPIDYLKAEQHAEKEKKVLLGIYHSHPDHPAVPSIHDLQVALPFFSYIILSVVQGKTKKWSSWRLDTEANLFEKEIVIL